MPNLSPHAEPRSLLLIVNSRRLHIHQREFDGFMEKVSRIGTPRVVSTQHAGHAISLAREGGNQFPVVAAVGGDGTVSEVATGILQAKSVTALLPVPLGTGNDFARAVGIRNARDAFDAYERGATRSLDAIEVDCFGENEQRSVRYSVLTAGVAFGAEVMRKTSDRIKRIFGSRAAYSVGLFLALASYAPPRLRVRDGSYSFDEEMYFVSIGNAEWSGGGTMCLSPGAKMDDGKFDVCVFNVRSRMKVLANFVRILKGTHIHLPEVTYFPATRLEIESEPASELLIDGEAFGRTPARFVMCPGVLKAFELKP